MRYEKFRELMRLQESLRRHQEALSPVRQADLGVMIAEIDHALALEPEAPRFGQRYAIEFGRRPGPKGPETSAWEHSNV